MRVKGQNTASTGKNKQKKKKKLSNPKNKIKRAVGSYPSLTKAACIREKTMKKY